MKLLELHIDGFGCLVERTFQFSPGFNLIYGPNEAGKSTLQQAIWTALYGFYDENAVTTAKRESVVAKQPWDPSAKYSISLNYELADGRRYQVTRVFGPRQRTTLVSLPNETDISGEYRSTSHGRLFFAESQLGVDRVVFENTCCLRQAELVQLEQSANAITDTLLRFASTGSTNETASGAIAALEAILREQIGTSRAWTKPLGMMQKRIDELQKREKQSRADRNALLLDQFRLNQIQERVNQLDLQRQRVEFESRLATRENLRDNLSKITEAATAVLERTKQLEQWQPWSAFPITLKSRITEMVEKRQSLLAGASEIAQRAQDVANELQKIQAEIRKIQERALPLEVARSVIVDKLPSIQRLQSAWEKAAEQEVQTKQRWQIANSALEDTQRALNVQARKWHHLIALGPVGLADMERSFVELQAQLSSAKQELELAQQKWSMVGMSNEEYAALEQSVTNITAGKVEPKVRKGCRFLQRTSSGALAAQEPTDVVIYRQISPIRTALQEANQRVNSAQANLKMKRKEIGEFLGSVVEAVDSSTFVNLKDQLDSWYRLNASVKEKAEAAAQAEVEVSNASERYAITMEQVRLALDQIGFGGQNAAQDLKRYIYLCHMKQQLEQEESSLDKLRLREQLLQHQLAQLQIRQRELPDLNAQLVELLAKAGISSTHESIDSGLNQFAEYAKNHESWVKAERDLEIELQRKHGLDQAFDAAKLDEDIRGLTDDISALRRQHPDWEVVSANKTDEEYRALSRDIIERLDSAKNDYRRQEDSIDRAKSSLEHTASIAEELTIAHRQVSSLERQRQILELANKELEEAAREYQKQFAPKLEGVLSDSLGRITNERYTNATVNPENLAVKLRLHADDTEVSSDLLSTGTRDLVFLALRIGLSKLLSNANEQLPLMLDDPLVHLDSERQTRMLEYLQLLSSETQILLFTKEDSFQSWFAATLSSKHDDTMQIVVLP